MEDAIIKQIFTLIERGEFNEECQMKFWSGLMRRDGEPAPAPVASTSITTSDNEMDNVDRHKNDANKTNGKDKNSGRNRSSETDVLILAPLTLKRSNSAPV